MIMSWPDSLQEKLNITLEKGSKSEKIVELRDVFPTFLEIAEGNKSDFDLDGQSLMCILKNNTESDPFCFWRDFIDLELSYYAGLNKTRQNWNAIFDGKYKYIFFAYDGSEALFDLEKDPGERDDLAKKLPSVTTLFRDQLINKFIREERGDRWVKNRKLQLRKKVIKYSPNYPQ